MWFSTNVTQSFIRTKITWVNQKLRIRGYFSDVENLFLALKSSPTLSILLFLIFLGKYGKLLVYWNWLSYFLTRWFIKLNMMKEIN